jgi:ribulose-phosphate 3-epimerase
MVVEPEPLLERFARAGIQILTFHPEVCEAPHRVIRRICELGMRAGIGLSPQAFPSLLNEFKRDIDLVIVMTIVPGLGGQRLIPEMIPRIAEVRDMLASEGERVLIAVDGQVSREVAPGMVRNGARILICGTASVFGHDPDAGVALESFRRDLQASLACSNP